MSKTKAKKKSQSDEVLRLECQRDNALARVDELSEKVGTLNSGIAELSTANEQLRLTVAELTADNQGKDRQVEFLKKENEKCAGVINVLQLRAVALAAIGNAQQQAFSIAMTIYASGGKQKGQMDETDESIISRLDEEVERVIDQITRLGEATKK